MPYLREKITPHTEETPRAMIMPGGSARRCLSERWGLNFIEKTYIHDQTTISLHA